MAASWGPAPASEDRPYPARNRNAEFGAEAPDSPGNTWTDHPTALRLTRHVPTVALFTHHLKTGQASAVRDYARHWAGHGDRTAVVRFESARLDVQMYANRRAHRQPAPLPTPIPYCEDNAQPDGMPRRRPTDLADLAHYADRIALWGLRQSVTAERLILASAPAATILVDALDPELTETYRAIKQCQLCGIDRPPNIFIVNADSEHDVDLIESKLQSLCARFLDIDLRCEGFALRPADVTLTPWPLRHDSYSSAETPKWTYEFVEMLQTHGCPPHAEDTRAPEIEPSFPRAELQTQRGLPLPGPILDIHALEAAIDPHLDEYIGGLRDSCPVEPIDLPDTVIRMGDHPSHRQLVIAMTTRAVPGLIETALAQLGHAGPEDQLILIAPSLTPIQRQVAARLPCPVRFHAIRQILLHHEHALLIDPPEHL